MSPTLVPDIADDGTYIGLRRHDGAVYDPAAAGDTPAESEYDSYTKKELNDELDDRGIEHDARAVNADLIALLVADDAGETLVDPTDDESDGDGE